MGVITSTQELTCSISPHRLLKALYLDSHNFLPKLFPRHIKSIEVLEGNGHVGTIKQTNFIEGGEIKFWKTRFEAIDVERCYVKTKMFKTDGLDEKFESITIEVKFEPSDTGSICKITKYLHTKPACDLTAEEIEVSKEMTIGFFKFVEEYLLANPTVYA